MYVERIRALALGECLTGIRLASPFVLRTVEPAPRDFAGRRLKDVSRLGKRLVLGFDGDLYAVLHLMLAGRLAWRAAGARLARRRELLAFDFASGALVLREASTKHRASLHLVAGREGLDRFDRGGADVLGGSTSDLVAALRRRNRTLKRALTDPRVVDGVGNAFSDEILHRARLSPFALTKDLDDETIGRLHRAAGEVLNEWIERLRAQAGEGFLTKVKSRRPEMAVHGKYGQPCPVCGAPVQRLVYAANEANYCPGCQTGGRVLADRMMSRLLLDDWPKTLDELEEGEAPGR